jgi:hypothetical protein
MHFLWLGSSVDHPQRVIRDLSPVRVDAPVDICELDGVETRWRRFCSVICHPTPMTFPLEMATVSRLARALLCNSRDAYVQTPYCLPLTGLPVGSRTSGIFSRKRMSFINQTSPVAISPSFQISPSLFLGTLSHQPEQLHPPKPQADPTRIHILKRSTSDVYSPFLCDGFLMKAANHRLCTRQPIKC